MTGEAHAERLLRMAAALEEAIIRLEARVPGDSRDTVYRLRRLQTEILTALSLAERDCPPPA